METEERGNEREEKFSVLLEDAFPKTRLGRALRPLLFVYIYLFIYFLFRAMCAAYRSSKARGGIRPVDEAYATATTAQDLSFICDPHCSLQQ